MKQILVIYKTGSGGGLILANKIVASSNSAISFEAYQVDNENSQIKFPLIKRVFIKAKYLLNEIFKNKKVKNKFGNKRILYSAFSMNAQELNFLNKLKAKLVNVNYDGVLILFVGNSNFNLKSFAYVLRDNAIKPRVFWYVIDYAIFTGGCHYPRGCDGYVKRECLNCPLDTGLDKNISYFNLKTNLHFAHELNLELVYSNPYVLSVIKNSLFNGFVSHNIRYPYLLNQVNITSHDKINIMLDIVNINDFRKGWNELVIFIELLNQRIISGFKFGNNEINFIFFDSKIIDFFADKIDIFGKANIIFSLIKNKLDYSGFSKLMVETDIFLSFSNMDFGQMALEEAILLGIPAISFNDDFNNVFAKSELFLIDKYNLFQYLEKFIFLIDVVEKKKESIVLSKKEIFVEQFVELLNK